MNVILGTYERPEMFRAALASALAHIPNIENFVIVMQSDYGPLDDKSLIILRTAPTGNSGITRQIGFGYLASLKATGPTFVMDDDHVIEPGFATGLPLVLDLLARSSTGLIACGMKHNPVSKTREVTLGNIGGGVFAKGTTVEAMGGWGDDPLDDIHSFLKSALAGFRNYITGQITNQHLLGSKGGLQASTGSKNRWEKRFRTRSASRMNDLYPGVFRKWDPTHLVFDVNKRALPRKRP